MKLAAENKTIKVKKGFKNKKTLRKISIQNKIKFQKAFYVNVR